MAISDTSITDVLLTNTFETWRTTTNQLITVLNENSDDNPTSALLSATSTGGLSINTVTANIVTGANVTGSKLLFSGANVDFTSANVSSLGNVHQIHILGGATVSGANPDSSIANVQLNTSEINLNGKNFSANGASTIDLSGATISSLGTVTTLQVNGGDIQNTNFTISAAQQGTISVTHGEHEFTGATMNGGTFQNATIKTTTFTSGNVTLNTGSTLVSNSGLILGSDVGTANVGIGHFPEWAGGATRTATSSGGRVHIRTEFAAASDVATSVDAFADELVLENGNNDVGMTFLTNTASNGVIAFADTDDTDVGFIIYNHSNDRLHLGTNGSNTFIIDTAYGGSAQIVGGDTVGTQAGKLHINVGATDATTALYIDSNDADQIAFKIDADQSTASVVDLQVDSLTTGSAIYVDDNSTSTGARKIVHINQDYAMDGGGTALYVKADGMKAVDIVQNRADKVALNVYSSTAHSTPLVSIIDDGAATSQTLYVRSDATTGSVTAVDFANSTASMFSVDAGGNVGINDNSPSYKLEVNGTVGIQGATNALSTLGVTGAVNALSTLGVTGAVNALSTLGVTGIASILNSTDATSKTTGALVVTGGVGIGLKLHVGTTITEDSALHLKENIIPIKNPLETISKLNGVSFDWKDKRDKRQIGLIAEDVRNAVPEAEYNGSVSYTKLVGLLVEGIKDLNKEISKLKAQING